MSGKRNTEALLHSIFSLLSEQDRLDMVEMCETIISNREKSLAQDDHDAQPTTQDAPRKRTQL